MTQAALKRRSKGSAREKLAAAGIIPRGLSLDEAAAYVNLSPKSFLAEVDAGRYPAALPHKADRLIWDRHALDRALDRISGLIGEMSDGVHISNAAAMDEAIENAVI
ncbi:hypothetical protein [Hyphomicrobium sp. 802]|uniref:hypothetical protein n=1 Tax=Hyphomicrobium sp. 802 TaxID=1112272 RepID=UPI00045E821D|nr:hypothetical protein [Hyphomicrobium sp. 802]